MELKDEIIQKAEETWACAQELWPKLGPIPKIGFKEMGLKAGVAWYDKRLVEYNLSMAYHNQTDFLKRTVAHELAHLIAWEIYNATGHKGPWRYIMENMGLTATTYHAYDTTHVPTKTKRIKYVCSCSVHMITMVKHNRIKRGTSYSCSSCGEIIREG